MILTIIGLLLIIIYVSIMCYKIKSIPPSVSETYYLGGGNWFILTLLVSSFLITAGMLNITDGSIWQSVSFLTGSGLAFVGASPKFREEMEHTVHYTGALILLVGSQLWTFLFGSNYIFLLWIPVIYWGFTKQRVFWCEITCLLTTLLTILFII